MARESLAGTARKANLVRSRDVQIAYEATNDTQRYFLAEKKGGLKIIGKIIKVNGEKEERCLASTKIKCFSLIGALEGRGTVMRGRWQTPLSSNTLRK